MDRVHPRTEDKNDGQYMSDRTCVVFGGSFDPPHLAHAMAVVFALSVLPDATVLLVPTYHHALGKRFVASYEQRLHMCKLAMADLSRTIVSDIERQLGGVSRTLDTLQALQVREPDTQFRLLIGADILAERDRWHRFEEVERLAPPLVIGRPGFASDAPFTLPDIASRELRRDLEADLPTDGRIATAVRTFIQEQGLYQPHSDVDERAERRGHGS